MESEQFDNVAPWPLGQAPTARQSWAAMGVSAAVCLAFGALAPFAGRPLGELNAFFPSLDAIVFIADLVTAVLLFAQFSISHSRAFFALASGYLFTALIVVPHALTFSGAFSPTGLLGANIETGSWLYIFWHIGFSLGLLGYAVLSKQKAASPSRVSALPAIGCAVAGCLGLVCFLTWLATAGIDFLPRIILDKTHISPIVVYPIWLAILVSASALAVLSFGRRSVLDQWLSVVAFVSILELVFSGLLPSVRFSLGFYAGRGFSILLSSILLIALLGETIRVYSRLAHTVVEQFRDRLVLERTTKELMAARDATAAETRIQGVLVAELQHRTRNLITVVQSIAYDTSRTADSLADFESRFNDRLEALSRAQSVLSRADKEPITLGALVRLELDALASGSFGTRITFAGPEAPLNKNGVEMLALAIHELLTNAIKYGALASEIGRLSITWHFEEPLPRRRLALEWVERGIVPREHTHRAKSGYGRRLIEEALPYSLSAETTFELGLDTLRCVIRLPLESDEVEEIAA